MTNYAHAYDEEPLDETDLYDMYNDMLDETNETVIIGNMTMEPSVVLKECDPIAYECGHSDYISFLLEDGDIIEVD